MTPSTSPPSELGAAHGWALLPATQRNLTIAKLIGAKLLSQFYLYIDGKEYSPLPHQAHEKEKAEGLAAYARSEGWAEFSARHGLKDEWRESVEARLIEWPLRYSDTPGGGWDVIEAMRNQGWNIEVASTGDGWMVTIDDNDPHHGRIIEHGPTMQTAACLAALRCPWPNDRTELRLPGSAATTTPKNMSEPVTVGNGDVGQTLAPVSLLGTVWRHKKKGGIYHVTELAPKRGDVYLRAETKGCRSTWKAECLLSFDYEQVPNA